MPNGSDDMRIAVDVGGTFTDAIGLRSDGSWVTAKTLSTPERMATGFAESIAGISVGLDQVELIAHGTTLALNSILTGSYPRTALITTAGFRDVLEIMRGNRTDLFDISQRKPPPLVPRPLRFEVRERIGADGRVVVPLDDDELDSIIAQVTASDVQAVAVCLLHSFTNPDHERRVGWALRSADPSLDVSLSHEVLPVFREFERTSTTVVNALAMPVIDGYLGEVEGDLGRTGFGGALTIMQSTGGLLDADTARRRPVSTLLSGPAGGVICAQEVGRQAGYENVISFDMGGTSCDVAAITSAGADRVTSFEIAGYPIQAPSLDIVSIGTGGGSIAWLDAGGALEVGPASAGADPGPACYGRGGTRPTVTDAAVVLGRYSAQAALGGALPIDRERAVASLANVTGRLGVAVEEAAWGVLRLINAKMANAVREVSVERGRDPRGFAVVAEGGAGAAHAFEVAQELGISAILVPAFPGVASAQGMLFADVRYEQVHTVYRELETLGADDLVSALQQLVAEVIERVVNSGVKHETVSAVFAGDCRYRSQTHELTVPIASGAPSPKQLTEAFHQMHRARYGHAFEDAPVELINLRAAGVGTVRGKTLGVPSWSDFPESERQVYWGPDLGWVSTPVLSRARASNGPAMLGPLIIEQSDATIVVPPSATVQVVADGVLEIRPVQRSAPEHVEEPGVVDNV
jgi:N-methylhydantoinase A